MSHQRQQVQLIIHTSRRKTFLKHLAHPRRSRSRIRIPRRKKARRRPCVSPCRSPRPSPLPLRAGRCGMLLMALPPWKAPGAHGKRRVGTPCQDWERSILSSFGATVGSWRLARDWSRLHEALASVVESRFSSPLRPVLNEATSQANTSVKGTPVEETRQQNKPKCKQPRSGEASALRMPRPVPTRILRNSVSVLFGFVGAGRPLPTGNRTAQHLASVRLPPVLLRADRRQGRVVRNRRDAGSTAGDDLEVRKLHFERHRLSPDAGGLAIVPYLIEQWTKS